MGVKGDKFQLTVCFGNYDDDEEAKATLRKLRTLFGDKIIETGVKIESGSGY